MGALLLFWASAACSAATSAGVAGVVRDADGVAQMGAMVQVLAAGSVNVANALTDMHGRYRIVNLAPGSYQVRVSSLLYAVGAQRDLRLSRGMLATVNLTLSLLADPAAWLPAKRRTADEPSDDWTWTLRATANRPILRVLGDGERAPAEGSRRPRVHGSLRVLGGSGGFGAGGLHTVATADRSDEANTDVMVRSDMGAPAAAGGAASREVAVAYERSAAFAGSYRVAASYADHPEIRSGDGAGMQALRIVNAKKMQLGDAVDVEAGGTVVAIHTSGTAFHASWSGFTTQPFLRVTVHPGQAWAVGYSLAESRDVQGFDDLDSLGDEPPVAGVAGGGARVESGMHQEVAVSRRAGDGVLEAAVFHDAMDRPGIEGVGAVDAAALRNVQEDAVVDTATGSFRLLGTSYTSNGVSVAFAKPVTPGVWVTVAYERGSGLAAQSAEAGDLAQVSAALRAEIADAVTASVKGKVLRTGTRLRVAYCWQPERLVTAVDAYDEPSGGGYLSFYVRQPLRWGDRLPEGLAATIDVANLLAQGYQPFLSADGRTLFLAESPRTVQAGLSFTF
ncbi:MAG TPA: TonB-dependent receptor [Acidobacteriaceae bacterium]|nr:TonB-dependent receptor [Acidobacteriaceae bacterium]